MRTVRVFSEIAYEALGIDPMKKEPLDFRRKPKPNVARSCAPVVYA